MGTTKDNVQAFLDGTRTIASERLSTAVAWFTESKLRGFSSLQAIKGTGYWKIRRAGSVTTHNECAIVQRQSEENR